MSVSCETWEEEPFGNLYIRKMKFANAGDYMEGHQHTFDHVTTIFKGKVLVVYKSAKDGVIGARVVSAPDHAKQSVRGEGYVTIKKDVHHLIIALEPNTEAWCMFAHRDHHGEVVQDFRGEDFAYG